MIAGLLMVTCFFMTICADGGSAREAASWVGFVVSACFFGNFLE